MGRRRTLFVALGVGAILGAFAGERVAASRSLSPAIAAVTMSVPLAVESPTIDGELEDRAWIGAIRTGSFTTGSAPSRPYSDARFTWREGTLFVTLYAADEDIRFGTAKHDDPLWTGDDFAMSIDVKGVTHRLDVSAGGVVTDGKWSGDRFDPRWESRARVAVDRDGTANDPSDQDEEWVVEIALPLSSVGLDGRVGERLGVAIERCDVITTPGQSAPRRVCARWPEHGEVELVLGSLAFAANPSDRRGVLKVE